MILQSISGLKNIPVRIVSLVPSQTELLYSLGLEESTIAITKFCVHPGDWLRSKIIIGGTKNLHTKQIKHLHPDLIIANKEENIKEQVEELAKDFPVWLTDVNNFRDALQMIRDIGQLTNTSGKAEGIIQNIVEAFSQLQIKKAPIPTANLIWRNPYMTIGGDTFINDMLGRCGLQNVFTNKTRYPTLSMDDLKKAGCRLVLLASEPYPFKKKHMDELQDFLPDTCILLADGEIFSWYGSRLMHAPAYLKKLMNQINTSLYSPK